MPHSDSIIVISALLAQALKEIGIPSPGVTQGALIYAGYQLAGGRLTTGSAIIAAVYAGSLAGALAAYAIGRSLGSGFATRPGRYLRLSARNLDRARERLGSGALWAVTVGRMVPAIMTPLSVVAGAARVPVPAFAGGVSLSTLAWAALLACLGAAGGRTVETLVPTLNVPVLVAAAAGSVLAAGLASLWWRSKQQAVGGRLDAR